MLPASKAIPKEMLPVFDKPAIQYIVEEAAKAGIENVLLIISKDKSAIADHFDVMTHLEEEIRAKDPAMHKELKAITDLCNVHFVRQKVRSGFEDAITYAETFVGNEPFTVLLGDDIIYHETPCIGQLLEVFNEYQCSIIEAPEEDVSTYGIVDGKKSEKIFMKYILSQKNRDRKIPLPKWPFSVVI